LAGQTAGFLIFVVLARLLTPIEFGLVAFLSLFVDLSRGVIFGGIPEALIQRRDWSDEAANTAFWLNVVSTLGFVVFAVAVALMLPATARNSTWLLAALSTTLLIDGSRAVHEAYLRRNFNYKLLAMRTVLASILGGIAGILAALAGLGVWALVVQRVLTSLIQTVTVWRLAEYRPSFRFARREVAPLLSFSTQVMAGRLMGQLNSRLPDFIIGFVAGPAALGIFRVASRSLNFLVQSLMAPLQTTTLSAFSRLKDASAVARAYGRFTQLSALIIFPAFLGSAAIADDFIRVFFGEAWAGGAWIMVALSFGMLPRTLYYFFQPAMQAIARPKRTINVEAVRLGIGAVLVGIASLAGPLAAAFGDMARQYLSTPQTLRILRDELGLRPWPFIKSLTAPLVCSLIMCGGLVALRVTVLAEWAPHTRLLLCVSAGPLIYASLLLIFARRFVADIMGSVRHSLPDGLKIMLDRCLQLVRIRQPAGWLGEPGPTRSNA